MTVYDYICRRWPNHAQRIIAATYEYDIRGAEYDLTRDISQKSSVQNILASLFIWQSTPEGHEYWKALGEGEECVDL